MGGNTPEVKISISEEMLTGLTGPLPFEYSCTQSLHKVLLDPEQATLLMYCAVQFILNGIQFSSSVKNSDPWCVTSHDIALLSIKDHLGAHT